MNYEEALASISSTAAAQADGSRLITWMDESRNLGVSRDHDGRLELYIPGDQLECRTDRVAASMSYEVWYRSGGLPSFRANRMPFPAAGYYDQVVAFLCAELIRNGVQEHPEKAFSAVEPIVALVLERMDGSANVLTGLAGELLLLATLLGRASEKCPLRELARSWTGYGASDRDFKIGSVGVEVKTTTEDASSHPVQGIHQVEVTDAEQRLFLVSVGIEWLDVEGTESRTISGLIEEIVSRLQHGGLPDDASVFSVHVRDYASQAGRGEPGWAILQPLLRRPFGLRFARTYDLGDPAVQILRSSDVKQRPFVDLDSVRFRIDLPATVSGDTNPMVGLDRSTEMLLEAASR